MIAMAMAMTMTTTISPLEAKYVKYITTEMVKYAFEIFMHIKLETKYFHTIHNVKFLSEKCVSSFRNLKHSMNLIKKYIVFRLWTICF